jgi:hypothetical protein
LGQRKVAFRRHQWSLPLLLQLNQNPVLTNIPACVHHVRTTHHSNTFSVSAQAGGSSSEVRICRINRPHNLPRKIHYDLQSSTTQPANHSPLAVASRERIWILMNHVESLCLTAVDGNPGPACICGRPAVFRLADAWAKCCHRLFHLTERGSIDQPCRSYAIFPMFFGSPMQSIPGR